MMFFKMKNQIVNYNNNRQLLYFEDYLVHLFTISIIFSCIISSNLMIHDFKVLFILVFFCYIKNLLVFKLYSITKTNSNKR